MPGPADGKPVVLQGKFPLGQVLMTPNAKASVPWDEMFKGLKRHCQGDWGNVGTEDGLANDKALSNGEIILSAYQSTDGKEFWILTEHDRSVTTILLPEDY